MDIKLTLVGRTISRNHLLILKKVNETSEVPAHSSAAYAGSVGENYVLAEPPIQETVTPSAKEELATNRMQAHVDAAARSVDSRADH